MIHDLLLSLCTFLQLAPKHISHKQIKKYRKKLKKRSKPETSSIVRWAGNIFRQLCCSLVETVTASCFLTTHGIMRQSVCVLKVIQAVVSSVKRTQPDKSGIIHKQRALSDTVSVW